LKNGQLFIHEEGACRVNDKNLSGPEVQNMIAGMQKSFSGKALI